MASFQNSWYKLLQWLSFNLGSTHCQVLFTVYSGREERKRERGRVRGRGKEKKYTYFTHRKIKFQKPFELSKGFLDSKYQKGFDRLIPELLGSKFYFVVVCFFVFVLFCLCRGDQIQRLIHARKALFNRTTSPGLSFFMPNCSWGSACVIN